MSTSAGEKKRQEVLEKKRQEMLADYAHQREKLQSTNDRDHTSADRFIKTTDSIQEKLIKSTVGLVNAEDFKRVREQLEEENRRKAAQTNELEKDDKKQKKKKKKKTITTLSFGDDEEGDAADADQEDCELSYLDSSSMLTPTHSASCQTHKNEQEP